jgi:Uma2 family endonuclease
MLADIKQTMTVTDFDIWADLPENRARRLEYIGGEIVEVPSNPYVSMIAVRIIGFLLEYLKVNDLGWVTGEGGGYMVAGERYAPDAAFISRARQPQLARKGYNPNPPDLAVEVISDPDNREEQTALRVKTTNYLAAGVVVWVVDYVMRVVEVHQPGKPVTVLAEDTILEGGDRLPGLMIPVKDIFPEESGSDGGEQ